MNHKRLQFYGTVEQRNSEDSHDWYFADVKHEHQDIYLTEKLDEVVGKTVRITIEVLG